MGNQLADQGEQERQAFRKLVRAEIKNALSEMGIGMEKAALTMPPRKNAQQKCSGRQAV